MYKGISYKGQYLYTPPMAVTESQLILKPQLNDYFSNVVVVPTSLNLADMCYGAFSLPLHLSHLPLYTQSIH